MKERLVETMEYTAKSLSEMILILALFDIAIFTGEALRTGDKQQLASSGAALASSLLAVTISHWPSRKEGS